GALPARAAAPLRIRRSCAYLLLAPRGRFVFSVDRSPERHELESFVARDRHSCRRAVDADEASRPKLELLSIDSHHARALHEVVSRHYPSFARLSSRWRNACRNFSPSASTFW